MANGETLDALLPEAFAVVREAGKRVHGMRHFDMQMVGGMVLHAGKIAEMPVVSLSAANASVGAAKAIAPASADTARPRAASVFTCAFTDPP